MDIIDIRNKITKDIDTGDVFVRFDGNVIMIIEVDKRFTVLSLKYHCVSKNYYETIDALAHYELKSAKKVKASVVLEDEV